MSAFHPKLEHGAGLIMLSRAYFGFFLGKIPDQLYVAMARAMGEDVEALEQNQRAGAFLLALDKLIHACGVETLKMSDYGIAREDLPALAKNAFENMGGLFEFDRYKLSFDETVAIYEKAYA